ncbi:MAG TPA: GNAT family N-acetyltransferase [Cyclobacteriaceae bacterium]|jgi:ribosomal protein S18 acetylase RimI-like enzyme|nr:GNAT family N-acetyltransferase [Cyclobacteriaceae bacterium]
MIEIKKIIKSNVNILDAGFSDLISDPGHQNKQVSLAHLEKLVSDDRSYLMVAINDGIIAGYALAYRFPSLSGAENLAYLYDIEVLHMHRRKGVGRLLIDALLANLKTDRVSELWLGTATDNTAAQALFSNTGAEKSDEVFNDYTYNL